MAEPAVMKRVENQDEPDQMLARLASLVRSNDRHLAEIQALNAGLHQAHAYLATPLANIRLGRAYLERIRMRRSRVLAVLRANRLAAREFLAI